MPELTRFEKHGRIGVLTVDNPPVNALARGVRQGLRDSAAKAAADDEIKALVVIAAGRTFMAGADIAEFGDMEKTANPSLPEVCADFEDCPVPVIAALHGTALGGGLETALACHYRIGVESLRVGLPEVKLGILPGSGGTQRLPRLIGVEAALPMILTGDHVPAARALELGIIDEIVEGDLLEAALAFAGRVVDEEMPLRRVRDMDDKLASARDNPAIFDLARQQLEKRARGYFSPWKIVEAVEIAVNLPFDEGLAKERELFLECMASPQSKGLIHAFFSERGVNKIPDVPRDTPAATIESAAVIGAGTMGGGIAMCLANAGIATTLIDVSDEAVEKGMATITKNYAATVAKGRLSQDEMDERLALITPTSDFDAVAGVDLALEAAFEEMDIKKELFARLDKTCKADAILATNTSTLDIDEIAAATSRPESVIGTHFFSPANVMRLLEVVRGAKSSKETIASAMKLGKTLRKVAVLAGNCDGFIGNRMVHSYFRQASFLIEEGALPQQVDQVMVEFGWAMGPFAVSDLAGMDVGWRIRQRRLAEGLPQGERYSAVADKLCEMGRFGQKTSAGVYRYEEGSRKPIPDPEIEDLIRKTSEELGIERREISDQEIVKRCIYSLVNEGAKILEEGMALRAADIDIVYIYGYGFPPYRGGPMFYADTVGLKSVYEDVEAFSIEHPGEGWEPAALLKKLADEGRGFGDL